MDRFIGKRLDGRYEIHELIGVGGMAYVYKAYDRVEGRWVAIKILKEEFSNNSDFLRRFRNESKAIAVLNHPNIVKVYDLAGVPCLEVSSVTGQGVDQVRQLLAGKVSAFTGNSGVGKSTLLNALFPEFALKTGEVSQKLGRGRHTTREVELYKLEGGGYVADTPGFSTFDIERYRLTDKEKLPYGFREFLPYLGQCQFTSCSHTCEKGCAILQAVEKGEIPRQRHESYCAMYQEIKDVKQWQQKNKNV